MSNREVAVRVAPKAQVQAVARANRIVANLKVSRSAQVTVATFVPGGGGDTLPGVHDHTEAQITDFGNYPDATGQEDGKIAIVSGGDWIFGDQTGGGGGIAEAPIDGTPYARQDASWVGVDTIEGPPGPAGADGAAGPPGGAVLSGNWTYSTATTGPASTGQVRTSPTLSALDTSGTMWLSSTDADGLDWSVVSVNEGDQFYLRSASGETWVLDVDAINAPGDYAVTLVSTTGTAPKKNEGVQVSLVRQGTGKKEVYEQPDEPAETEIIWWDSDANGSAPVSYWRAWFGTQAAYDGLGSYDPGTLYVIEDA